ncbi:MAG: hypothetical protein PXX82_07865 [Methanomassiliicoccales archaeon]|nr:hypothetical protein [Methanomassiliicoccales archaeon]
MASEEYRVNYSEITKIYRNERKDVLTELPGDFYAKARLYIEELTAEEERSRENSELSAAARSQINEATKLLRHIWEFRTRKLMLLAVSQRHQAEVELRGLADEERALLSKAVSVVRLHEKSSLDGKPQKEEYVTAAKTSVETVKERVETVNEYPEPPAQIAAGIAHTDHEIDHEVGEQKMVLLRFISDAPKFSTEFGEFSLKKGEVANIPAQYAKILTNRKVAVEIASHGI